MSKTCKKLLAAVLVAAMLVSTLVSGLAVSAATTLGKLTIENTTFADGDTVEVKFTVDFEGKSVNALHMLATIDTDLTITDAELGTVEYGQDYEDSGIPGLSTPALNISAENLTNGEALFESGVSGDVLVNSFDFTVTFEGAEVDADNAFAITLELTDYDEEDYTPLTGSANIVIEAAQHVCEAKDLVNNENGTHTVKCECGEAIETVDCVYENGFCACGAEEPAPECDHADAELVYDVVDGNCVTTKVCPCGEYEEVIASTANIKFGHAPVYESALTLIFRMPATHVSFFTNYTDVKAIVTKDMYDGTTKINPVVTEIEGELQANSNRTQFVYNGVRAMDMTANLNCQVFGTDANGNVVLLAEEDYTFATYLETAFNAYKNADAGTKNAAECKLVADVAYYGAAAQLHFDFNTDNLASANIPESYTTGTFALEDFNFDGTLDQSGVSFGRSPNYRDKILLNIRFVKSAVADGAYVTVDYKTTSGSEEQIRVDFAAFEQDPSNTNRYQVVFDKLTAACIPTEFTIKLCDAEGNVLGYSVYGMEIYAYQATKSSSISATEKTLVNELVAYGRSANAYFNFGK